MKSTPYQLFLLIRRFLFGCYDYQLHANRVLSRLKADLFPAIGTRPIQDIKYCAIIESMNDAGNVSNT
jgi:hypothetical protein